MLVASLGVALVGLAADRLLLSGGPSSAEAAGPAPVAPERPASSENAPRAASTPASADLAAIRDRLAALPASPLPPAQGDALTMPQAWAATIAPEVPVQEATPVAMPARLPQLSAIVRSAEGGLAKLDGRFVRVGEQASGMEVVQILPRSVVLKDASGRSHTVELPH
jgi:hypothetical protein